jgi:hypothetical protein
VNLDNCPGVEIQSTLNFVHSTPKSLESPPSLPSKNPFSINRLPDAARQMLSDGRLRNPLEASPPKVALLSDTSTMWSKKHKKRANLRVQSRATVDIRVNKEWL